MASSVRRHGVPIGWAIDGANRNDVHEHLTGVDDRGGRQAEEQGAVLCAQHLIFAAGTATTRVIPPTGAAE